MDEEAVAAGNIDVTNLKVRSRNWIYARSIESSGGNLKFNKPETPIGSIKDTEIC